MSLDYIFFISVIFILTLLIFLLIRSNSSKNKEFYLTREDLIEARRKIDEYYAETVRLKIENERLSKLKNNSQKSVEAEQLIHDMTVYGQSIVKILPMNPNDIFWRSPK